MIARPNLPALLSSEQQVLDRGSDLTVDDRQGEERVSGDAAAVGAA
jgi:hypothetical protein